MNKLFTIKYNDQILEEDIFDIIDLNIPILKEFNAFREFSHSKIYKKFNYSGIVSSKFKKKTGISKSCAMKFIEDRYDIILFHPYPLELKIQKDFLHLAEYEHPGIKKALDRLWYQIYNEKLPNVKLPENLLYCVHCNYFIANEFFWEDYSRIIDKIDSLYKEGYLDYLFEKTNYNLSDKQEYTMELFPFVFERLLTHFLYKNKKKFKIKNISLESEFKPISLFKFESEIIKMLLKINNKKISTYVYFKLRKIILKNSK